MLCFLIDNVQHFVVVAGSKIFSVKFDFLREYRTEEFDFHLWRCPFEEFAKVPDEVDGVGKLVFDL